MILVTDYQVIIEHVVKLNSHSVDLVIFAKIEFQGLKKVSKCIFSNWPKLIAEKNDRVV